MSSSSNSVAVIAIEADSQGALKALKTPKTSLVLLSPDLSPGLQPNKLGISRKIPGRTLVVPKD
jgi:hypothetical protein